MGLAQEEKAPGLQSGVDCLLATEELMLVPQRVETGLGVKDYKE